MNMHAHGAAAVALPLDDEPRSYTYDELSDRAKERVRDRIRTSEWYLSYDWWDYVYEYADEVAKIMGIDISHRQNGGRPTNEKAIYFSGFWSQGDGACFEGRWEPGETEGEAYARFCKIVDDYGDTELHEIAFDLADIRTMNPLAEFSASITHSGHYVHEHCTEIMVDLTPPELDGMRKAVYETLYPDDRFEDIDYAVTGTLRSFMRWIYRRLEEEYEHLVSDEVIDEYIAANRDDVYDEDGDVL